MKHVHQLSWLVVFLFIFTNIKVCYAQLQGGSSQQIMEQQRQHQMNAHPAPPPTQSGIRAMQERQRNGKPPTPTLREHMQRQVTESILEAHEQNEKVTEGDYYRSPEYLQDLPRYEDAIEVITQMLNGQRALSIKDAFYKAEAAFGMLHMAYEEYNSLIAANADFIRQWLRQNKFDLNKPEALHYGIQKFMSDTLYITVNGVKSGHMPFFYDYIDYNAKQDKRNYFVTKTLATGTGQCHTFPVVYLILSEALNAEAFLAYNPRHSFIRFKNGNGVLQNYETTVDRLLVNSFYLQTLPVMAGAQKNNVYIHNLTKKQVVATVLYELASNFIREHWVADEQLIHKCLKIAEPHFPKQHYVNNTESYLRQRLFANEINQMVQQKQITRESEIKNHPDLFNIYQRYLDYMEKVTALDVQEFPEEEELRFAEYADEKGRLMQARGINSKQKRSLFIH